MIIQSLVYYRHESTHSQIQHSTYLSNHYYSHSQSSLHSCYPRHYTYTLANKLLPYSQLLSSRGHLLCIIDLLIDLYPSEASSIDLYPSLTAVLQATSKNFKAFFDIYMQMLGHKKIKFTLSTNIFCCSFSSNLEMFPSIPIDLVRKPLLFPRTYRYLPRDTVYESDIFMVFTFYGQRSIVFHRILPISFSFHQRILIMLHTSYDLMRVQ